MTDETSSPTEYLWLLEEQWGIIYMNVVICMKMFSSTEVERWTSLSTAEKPCFSDIFNHSYPVMNGIRSNVSSTASAISTVKSTSCVLSSPSCRMRQQPWLTYNHGRNVRCSSLLPIKLINLIKTISFIVRFINTLYSLNTCVYNTASPLLKHGGTDTILVAF